MSISKEEWYLYNNDHTPTLLELERRDEEELTSTSLPHRRHAKKPQAEEHQIQKKET